jgi:hypothetical protein
MRKTIKVEEKVMVYSLLKKKTESGEEVEVKENIRETTLKTEQEQLDKIDKKIAKLAVEKIKQEAIVAQIESF